MDLWIAGLIQASISGVVLLFLTKSLEKVSETSKRAAEAEKTIIQNDLDLLGGKLTSLEGKQGELTRAFYSLKEKVVIIAQKQDDYHTRIHELIDAVDDLKTNYGGMARK